MACSCSMRCRSGLAAAEIAGMLCLSLLVGAAAQQDSPATGVQAAGGYRRRYGCRAPPTPSAPANTSGWQGCVAAASRRPGTSRPGSSCAAPCLRGYEAPWGSTPPTAVCRRDGTWAVNGSCVLPALRTVASCQSNCGAKLLVDATTRKRCFCDYYCNAYNDCCGSTQSKDAACPSLRPTANMTLLQSCSARVGLDAGAPTCGHSSYRPAGCWCDRLCSVAGDCCSDCPSSCQGAGGVCPARPPSPPPTPSSNNTGGYHGALGGRPSKDAGCGAHKLAKKLWRLRQRAAGEVTPAAWTKSTMDKVTECMEVLTGMDLTTPAEVIKVVWVEAKLKGSPNSASTYPLSKKRAIIQALNNAFARLGLSFQLVQTYKWEFSQADEVEGTPCIQGDVADWSDSCDRCAAYRAARKEYQAPDTLFYYSLLAADADAADLSTGSGWMPQQVLDPNPPVIPSCLDGVFVAEDNSTLFGAAQDGTPLGWSLAYVQRTAAHEVGHYLGLEHTWSLDDSADEATTCAEQQELWADAAAARDAVTDGVRDTPPQPLSKDWEPMRFECDAAGNYHPGFKNAPASSCLPEYINNVANVMSYFFPLGNNSCFASSAQRKRTFTPGQLARAWCSWACYRKGLCKAGRFTFPYTNVLLG